MSAGCWSAETRNGSASSAAGSMRRTRPTAARGSSSSISVDGSVLWSYTKANNADPGQPHAGAARDRRYGQRRVHRYGLSRRHRRQHVEVQVLQEGGRRFLHARPTGRAGAFSRRTAHRAYRPIYTLAAVAKDASGNLWVYWGTGDKTDPTAANAQEKIFAVKDTDWTSTRTIIRSAEYHQPREACTTTAASIRLLHQPGRTGREDAGGPGGLRRGPLRDHLHARAAATIPASRAGRRSSTASISRRAAGRSPSAGEHRSPPQHDHRNGDPIRSGHFAEARRTGTPDLYVTTSGGGCYRRPDSAGEHQSPRSGESHQFALLERQARGVITRLSSTDVRVKPLSIRAEGRYVCV